MSAYIQNHKENEKSLEVRLLQQMSKFLGDELHRARTADSGIYLGTVANKTDEDAANFRMYLDIADKMGFQLGDDAINKLIRTETFGDLSEEDSKKVDQQVRGKHSSTLSTDQIRQAVGDEFRAAMVSNVMQGSQYSGKLSIPAVMTPYEFFESFKDRRTELTWQVIDVPVDAFMDLVKDEPTEKELREFFDKFRNQEYDPSRESPGLKEPRKVQIQFLTVDAKSPIYKDAQAPLDAAKTIAGGLTANCPGGNALGGALQIATPLLAEPLYLKQLISSKIAQKQPFNLFDHPFASSPVRPRDSSAYHPLPDAALTAQLAAMINPIAGLTSAIASYDNLVNLIETRDRVRFGMQLALAPYDPFFPFTVVGSAFANAPTDPKSVYELEAAEEWKNAKRPEALAKMDLESLTKKLTDLRQKFRETNPDPNKKNEPDKINPMKLEQANAEAQSLIDQWLKNHPKATTGTSGVDDKYQLAEDPALKDVFAQWKDIPNMTDFPAVLGQLFYTSPSKEPIEAGLYTPVITSRDDPFRPVDFERLDFSKPVYATWKFDDKEAKAYKEVKDIAPEKLLRAWKMLKARDLARKAAETVVKEATSLAQTQLRDASNWPAFRSGLKDKLKELNPSDPTAASRVIDLGDIIKIAPLEKPVNLQMTRREEGYRPPQITNKEIKFPPPERWRFQNARSRSPGMAEQLIDLRDKPLGEAVVIPNVPKTHYYVAVLIKKDVPNEQDFNREVFQNTNPPVAALADRFYSEVAFPEAFRAFSKDEFERMKAETAFKETEELKKLGAKAGEAPE